MKKVILTVMLCNVYFIFYAQSLSSGVYAFDKAPVICDLSTPRLVVGGTVIKPKYIGNNINETIKHAFDYACRIWEEKIPTTYPLNISMSMQPLNDSTLANVITYYCGADNYPKVERTWNKRMAQTLYHNPCLDYDFENDEDGVIIFNSNMDFDYNTDPTKVDSDKYDFITVAIQAIAKLFGFYTEAFYFGGNVIPLDSANCYTTHVLNGGTVNYNSTINSSGFLFEGRNLYAPDSYDSRFSLNYFELDSTNHETLFLQPGVAKGAAIRHVGIAMDDYFDHFEWYERWVVVGDQSSSSFSGAYTDEVIDIFNNDDIILSKGVLEGLQSEYRNDDFDYFRDCGENRDVGIYVLLKDGSWRSISSIYNLNITDDSYSRTCDGYLRVLIVQMVPGPGGNYFNKTFQYRLVAFPPQTPEFDINSYEEADLNSMLRLRAGKRSLNTNPLEEDNECLNVEIGFSKVEGTEYVVVEQLDSDWPVPYTYYADPSAGVFSTIVGKRSPSTITLTYINEYGQKVSNPKVIDFSSEFEEVDPELLVRCRGSVLRYQILNVDSLPSLFCRYGIVNERGILVQSGSISSTSGNIPLNFTNSGVYTFSVRIGNEMLSATFLKL